MSQGDRRGLEPAPFGATSGWSGLKGGRSEALVRTWMTCHGLVAVRLQYGLRSARGGVRRASGVKVQRSTVADALVSPTPTQSRRQRCRLGQHYPRPGEDGLGAVQVLLRQPSRVIPDGFPLLAGVLAGVGPCATVGHLPYSPCAHIGTQL